MYARGSNVYFYKIKVFDLGNDLVRTGGKDQMQPEGCKREVIGVRATGLYYSPVREQKTERAVYHLGLAMAKYNRNPR